LSLRTRKGEAIQPLDKNLKIISWIAASLALLAMTLVVDSAFLLWENFYVKHK